MIITSNTKEFCKLLQVGGAFAGKNKVYPLSAYVKITTKGNRVKVESTDYQNSIKEFGVLESCDADGSFFVNYADLYNYISAISGEIINLNVDTEKKFIVISHSEGEISLPVETDGAFVDFPTEDNAKSFEIDREVFEEWVGLVPTFCAHDIMRPTISGMYVYAQKNGKVGYCGTDAAVLIANSIDNGQEIEEDFNFIINDASLGVISKMLKLKSKAEGVRVSATATQVFIKADTTTMCCRLSEGNYPPFEKIIPNDHPYQISVSRDALMSAIRRAANAKDQKSNKSILSVSQNGYVSIALEDVATAKASNERIAAQVTGEDVSISVNYALLANCLSAIKSDTVKCLMKGSTFSIVFKDEAEPNQTILLMPML